jgi:hypothetical protein
LENGRGITKRYTEPALVNFKDAAKIITTLRSYFAKYLKPVDRNRIAINSGGKLIEDFGKFYAGQDDSTKKQI